MQGTRGAGAGIVNFRASPVVRNCIITGNAAMKGGGVYNMTRGSGVPVFINVTISDNYAFARGGGMSNDLSTSPLLVNVRIINNRTDSKGGGIYNDFSCSPTIINALFAGNQAETAAAIGNDGSSSPRIVGATFTGNIARDMGAALYQGSYRPGGSRANNPVMLNSIIWGNVVSTFGPVSVFNWADDSPDIRYSIVEGGYPGQGNLDADPLFKDPARGDYSLAPGSPAINAGTVQGLPVTVDILGLPRGEAVDLGAFEFASDAEGAVNTDEIQNLVENLAEDLLVSMRLRSGPGNLRPGPGQGGGWTAPSERIGEFTIPNRIFRVNAAGSVSGDGHSWQTPFRTVQEGIDAAAATGGGEVWVAEGTYTPTTDSERIRSITLKPYVAVYGGFNGSEKVRDERDSDRHETVFSGDIGISGAAADNSYHVVRGARYSILDGVTVTAGNANGQGEHRHGGGMLNYSAESSPALSNLIFRDNYAIEGGAIYNFNGAVTRITGCHFFNNRAEFGGALYNNVGANGLIIDCLFQANIALYRGGAVVIDYGSSPTFGNVTFTQNSTRGNGGAAWVVTRASQLEASKPVFNGCTFNGNRAELRGGAIHNYDSSRTTIRNCTFRDNAAGTGGGALANDMNAAVNLISNSFSNNQGGTGEDDIDDTVKSP